MGTGMSEGPNRSMAAANAAISSPLLEDASVKGARGVIINVTGGPDLSLVEVSEASVVIQEAAHEDANIIFGAVVDPAMEGKVKITVIATGFDRPAASKSISPSSVQTPVDLQNYTSWRQESGERVAAAGGGGARMSITRRPGLELPLMPPAVEPDGNGAPGAEFEPVSPLDVPAFLRRQSEA
jgi:cell division protein FtsZ